MNVEEAGSNEPELEEEFELEIEDDTPEEDRGREPMPKEIVEELEQDELDSYDEKAKQRLKQMRKVYHDERREKERESREKQEALSLAKRYYEEAQKLRKTVSQGEETLIKSASHAAELEAEKARQDYRNAYEAGDTDKVLAAQEKLTEANMRLAQIKNYRPTSQPDENEVNIPSEPVNQTPRPDAKSLAWQERNSWWGNDEEMTASALGLHSKLIKQYGVEYAGTDEYWSSIDTTMRRRFPEHFGESEKQTTGQTPKSTKAATVVAPASRSTSPKKIVLTKSQISIANRLGLTPEQYAREMKKLEA